MGKAPQNLSTSAAKRIKEILAELDGRYPIGSAVEFGGLVNYSQASDEPIQRWFRYREGYSTRLVEKILTGTRRDRLVVDPFCGAGTTLLAAKRQGFQSVGIDANPISVFVAKVKTRTYSPRLVRSLEALIPTFKSLTPSADKSPKPGLSIIDKVFNQEVLSALLILRNYIETQLAGKIRDLCLLAWLAILEDVSNVYKEGNGIKYRNRKRTPDGYIEIPMDDWQDQMFPKDRFGQVIDTYCNHLRLMLSDLRSETQTPTNPQSDVFEGDAIEIDEFVAQDSANLVVFSPPYANNFNYFKAYKVELWMGGFISNYDELKELTRKSLRSHVETQLQREGDKNSWYPEELDTLLELISPESLWTPRIPKAVRGYFYDMHSVLKGIYTILEDEGRCAIVVGNSAYGSVPIPTDVLLAEMANVIGFKVESLDVARHLTTSSQQKQALEPFRKYLRESILFLSKPKHRTAMHPMKGAPEVHYRYVDELPRFPKQPSQIIYVLRNRGLTDLTHKVHKWPSKFIPHVPRWAIQKYLGNQTDKVLLDPFCGSGTTLVEGALAGQISFGIDIDPLARLISKVKSTPLDARLLHDVTRQLTIAVNERNEGTFRPSIDSLAHWFRPSVVRDLGIIRDIIERWRDQPDVYDFLIVTMSSIVRRVSNADNQSLKTYVSGTFPKKAVTVKPLFLKMLKENAESLIQFGQALQNGGTVRVLHGFDARDFGQGWLDRKLPLVDIAITSPPYIKSIDIIYNQMVELFWIGDLFELENQEKQNKAKQKYIGTEKVSATDYKSRLTTDLHAVDAIVGSIYERDRKHAYIVATYFNEMRAHFAQMRRILRPGSPYVFVVGESTVSDIRVPTAELISQIAFTEGFELEEQFVYEIRNRYMRFPRQGRGGIVDLDWVLTFRNKGAINE
jgi:DNA modification methylase